MQSLGGPLYSRRQKNAGTPRMQLMTTTRMPDKTKTGHLKAKKVALLGANAMIDVLVRLGAQRFLNFHHGSKEAVPVSVRPAKKQTVLLTKTKTNTMFKAE